MKTVVTTANGIGQRRAGAKDMSIDRVDCDGNAALIRASAATGVDRFMFFSALGMTEATMGRVPLIAAKRSTER